MIGKYQRRSSAKARLAVLSGRSFARRLSPGTPQHSSSQRSLAAAASPERITGLFERRLLHAGLTCRPSTFGMFCGALAALAGFLGALVFPAAAALLFSGFAAALPLAWVDRMCRLRADELSADYPAVLLGAASSVRVGMTPENALLRSIRLLPASSVARGEVELLLKRLRDGMPKDEALQRFGEQYCVPDLELFRSAFLLVSETGGRFSPTLERLATVSNARMSLIQMAAVSTASMRMTANALLGIAPVLILFLSTRIEGYWNVFRSSPAANALASAGILLIAFGSLTLRRMSSFRA